MYDRPLSTSWQAGVQNCTCRHNLMEVIREILTNVTSCHPRVSTALIVINTKHPRGSDSVSRGTKNRRLSISQIKTAFVFLTCFDPSTPLAVLFNQTIMLWSPIIAVDGFFQEKRSKRPRTVLVSRCKISCSFCLEQTRRTKRNTFRNIVLRHTNKGKKEKGRRKFPANLKRCVSQTIHNYLNAFQLLSMSSGSTPATTVTTSCCETGRPIMTDPTTGQTVCSCQYSSATSLLSYPAAARSLSESVYNSYAAQGYVPFGADPSAFYSPLVSQSVAALRGSSVACGVRRHKRKWAAALAAGAAPIPGCAERREARHLHRGQVGARADSAPLHSLITLKHSHRTESTGWSPLKLNITP